MQGAFDGMIRQIQMVLTGALSGPMGPMVRSYLPQVWVFETDRGTVTLAADAGGRITSFAGGMQQRDVTVRVPYDRLVAAFQSSGGRRGPPASGAPPQVTYHTEKGNTAFGFLRSEFGL